MTYEINETHDPNLKSWVESANSPDTDFPIQNLPFVYYDSYARNGIGIVIGNQVLDLSRCYEDGLFYGNKTENVGWKVGRAISGFQLFECEPSELSAFRRRLVSLLREEADENTRKKVERNLLSIAEVTFDVPCYEIPNYTDFYCSIFHATNVG